MRVQSVSRANGYLTTSDFVGASVGDFDDVILVKEISIINVSANTRSIEAWVVDSSDVGNLYLEPTTLYPNDHLLRLPNLKLSRNQSLIIKGEGTTDLVCSVSGLRYRR